LTRPAIDELLRRPGAVLYRGDFFALGLGRRAVDAIFKEIGRELPGCRRPVVFVEDWLAFKASLTYRSAERVRPIGR
jgi:hypothetical protein